MQDNQDKDLPESAIPLEEEMASVEQNIEADLLTAQAKVEELNEAWLRARADIENMRRRTQEDIGNAHKYSIGKFATDLLSVKDSLEMALNDPSGQFDSLKNGVELTLKQLTNVFERFQVNEINPVGEKLDPHKHQAISMQPSEAEINTILEVMQKGYQLHDRVLRPAMVIVSNGKPAE
jgi:molecular chaperone GrpE